MGYIESIILGIVQGVAEFLPISSSGHLAVIQKLMGLQDVPIIYDILLHVASLFVVLFYFRKLIVRLFAVLFRWIGRRSKVEDKEDLFMILGVIIATGVTFIGYLVLKKIFGDKIDQMKDNLIFVCSFFLVTALILLLQRFVKFSKRESDLVSPWQAFSVGAAQILGLFPGISRSGSTISAAVLSGVSREKAGELSFLISIPAILGSLVFKLKDLKDYVGTAQRGIELPVLLVGMFFALLSGMIAFPLLLKILKRDRLWWFSIYLVVVGVVGLILNSVF